MNTSLPIFQELIDEANTQLSPLSTAEVLAQSISQDKKDDPKAIRDVNDKLNSVKGPLVDVLEKLNERKQNLETAQEQLQVYRAQLEPVREVFTQVEETVVSEEPVDLDKGEDELGKVDVSRTNIKRKKRGTSCSEPNGPISVTSAAILSYLWCPFPI